MCCVTRSALCWTSIASWNLSKAICAHIFMCFSICNCSLMRLIRLHGMLKMRSRNAASGDQPALHVGIILDVLQYHSRYNHRSPIYDMHPMFSHQRDGWQLQTRFGDVGGDWFPACSALPSLDDDQDEVLMQSVLDHDTQLTCLWNIHEQCWKLVQVKIPVYFFHRSIIKWGSDKGLRVRFSGAAECEGWGGVCGAGKQAHSALGRRWMSFLSGIAGN